MYTYEVSWQFEEGTAEWADSFLYDATDIEALGRMLRSIKNDRDKDDYTNMSVIFAQILDDDLDADERDVTDELPEDILAD